MVPRPFFFAITSSDPWTPVRALLAVGAALLAAFAISEARGQQRPRTDDYDRRAESDQGQNDQFERDYQDRQYQGRDNRDPEYDEEGSRREQRRDFRRQQRRSSDESASAQDDSPMRRWIERRLERARSELLERMEELERELAEREREGVDVEDIERELEGVRSRLRDREGLMAEVLETWRQQQSERTQRRIEALRREAELASREGRAEEAANLRREIAGLRAALESPSPGRAARLQALRQAIGSLRDAGLDDIAAQATEQLQQWIAEGENGADELTPDEGRAQTGDTAIEARLQEMQRQRTALEATVRDLRTEVQQLRRELEAIRSELQVSQPATRDVEDGSEPSSDQVQDEEAQESEEGVVPAPESTRPPNPPTPSEHDASDSAADNSAQGSP